MDKMTFPIENNALTAVPIFESHKRGRNWLAVIAADPTAPGGLRRQFLGRGHGRYYYLLGPAVTVNAPIEFGADYQTSGGHTVANRWYGVIVGLTDAAIEIEKYDSAELAIAAAAAAAAAADPRRALRDEAERLRRRLAEIEAELAELEEQ